MKSPHADVRDVNQSAFDNENNNGRNDSSNDDVGISFAILHNDSTAFSLTTNSSAPAKICNGGNKQTACSAPPTNSIKFPNSSDNTTKTSSSSSRTESCKYGINSVRVRSGPNAFAID